MKRHLRSIFLPFISSLALLAASPAPAQFSGPPPKQEKPIQYKLPNGFTVIIKPDRRAPTAVHMVYVRAGAMDPLGAQCLDSGQIADQTVTVTVFVIVLVVLGRHVRDLLAGRWVQRVGAVRFRRQRRNRTVGWGRAQVVAGASSSVVAAALVSWFGIPAIGLSAVPIVGRVRASTWRWAAAGSVTQVR